MAPLLVLLAVTAVARLIGLLGVGYVDGWPDAIAVGLAAMLVLTASAHFTSPRRAGLIAIVPPAIPRPALVITATGVLELAAAAGLLVAPALVPGMRAAAAFGLALLLVAMFPANVYAAGGRRHPAAPHTPLALRTAIQAAFLAAALVVGFASLP